MKFHTMEHFRRIHHVSLGRLLGRVVLAGVGGMLLVTGLVSVLV